MVWSNFYEFFIVWGYVWLSKSSIKKYEGNIIKKKSKKKEEKTGLKSINYMINSFYVFNFFIYKLNN